MLTVVTLAGALAAATGIGYTASRPLLDDGSTFLGKGHEVAHVNGETREADAETAMRLANGKEQIQTVRLPDGRAVTVNKETGTMSYLDAATLDPDAPLENRRDSRGQIDPVPTESDGYLVDRKRDTVEKIAPPGKPAPKPVHVEGGIKATAPSANSVWVVTESNEVIEVIDGREVRRVQLGASLLGITVADSHPVVVADDGTAYLVDGEQPRVVGKLGVAGPAVKLGSWAGAGRQILAVDVKSHQFAVLDPRTGRGLTVALAAGERAELDAPVMLREFAYLPDYSAPRPRLWKIDLSRGKVTGEPMVVPGQPGYFDLKVDGGRVWANNQYDRSVLIVNADGQKYHADKGDGPELTDTEGQTGPPDQDKGTGTKNPPPDRNPPDRDPAPQAPPKGTGGKTVTVPSFERGTSYEQACERLEELGLRCRPVAVGENEPGLDAGDVLGTSPAAGRRVPVPSRVVVRYVGPLRTPSVVGSSHQEACRQIRSAELSCARNVADDEALAPEQLGLVSEQDPPANADIDRGNTVTITYRDSIRLPSFVNQPFTDTCTRLEDLYKMTCHAVPGDPAIGGRQGGHIQAQEPIAGTLVKMDATITVRYYVGENAPGSVIGSNIDAACATIESQGHGCIRTEAGCAWGTGYAVGEVSDQKPAAGTQLAVGTDITLTFYTDKCPLGDYRNTSWESACSGINRLGFQCNPVQVLHPTPGTVVAQDPVGGTQLLGTVVTIHWSPWTPMQIAFGTVRGTAYPPGTGIPYPRTIYHYTCNKGGTKCRGLPRNEFYSHLEPGSPTIDTDFDGAQAAVLMTCGTAAGQRKVWRTWNGGSPRHYQHVVSETAPPADDVEELGCIW